MRYKFMMAALIAGMVAAIPVAAETIYNTNDQYAVRAGVGFGAKMHENTKTCTGGYFGLAIRDGRLEYTPTITVSTINYDRPYAGISEWLELTRRTSMSLTVNVRYNGFIGWLPQVSPYVFSGIGGVLLKENYKYRYGDDSRPFYDGIINFGAGFRVVLWKYYSLEIQGRYPAYLVDDGFWWTSGVRVEF
jgi:hypothetical protein